MRVKVIAVGRLGRPHYRAAADVYKDRLKHYNKFEEIEVREARKVERRNTGPAVEEEGKRLLAAVPKGALCIAMDERGKEMDSARFAELIEDQMVYGRNDLCFLVGGALGLAPMVKKSAERSLALSRMTMPHELARVVLMEQIYRAMTIIRGEPYHK
jgi:23S rRNA (pseudouridine1915-N3)-methyltransferase